MYRGNKKKVTKRKREKRRQKFRGQKKKRRQPSRRVFARCVGKAAFIDKAVMSCSERPSDDFEQVLRDVVSVPVLRSGGRYSRRVSATEILAGNPVRIIYGRIHRFPNLPVSQLTLQS